MIKNKYYIFEFNTTARSLSITAVITIIVVVDGTFNFHVFPISNVPEGAGPPHVAPLDDIDKSLTVWEAP